VSIILTVFNSESLLKWSVESLLRQTHGRLEVWLVDDASTDQTWAVIQELCTQDSRLCAIRLSKNIGTYAAKSLVLPSVSGEYVTCHDADDLASPYWIETQLDPMLRDPTCVASVSRWFRIDSTGEVVPGSSRDVWPVLSLNQTSLLMRRRVLDSIGGWDIARVSGDVEIFERIRAIYGVQALRVIDQALVVGLHIPTSLMNDNAVGLASGDQQQLRRHLQYREAWVEWQASCLRAGELPRMPDISSRVRPFVSPKAFEVAHEDVMEAIACVEQQVMAHDESVRH
jgi:glycosyltransferase involved in cell wall biosynthesis